MATMGRRDATVPSAPPSARLPVSSPSHALYGALVRTLLLALGLVLLLWFLFLARTVLLATVFALIVAIALNGPVTWLEARRWPRGWAIAATVIAVAAALGAALWLVVPRLLAEVPTLAEAVPALANQVARRLGDAIGDRVAVEQQVSRALDLGLGALGELWRYTDVALEAVVLTLYVVALVLFAVANLRGLLRWYVRSMPPRHRDRAARAFARGSRMVVGWVVGSVVIGVLKGVAAFVFLAAVGVPGALVWSVLSFVAAFVPQIGFYLMTIPPVAVAFTVSPLTALWTLIYFLAFSELLGKFVAPRVFAQTMELSAVYVLIMTVAMGYAFGAIGVLIAAPVAGFVKAYYDAFYLERQPEDPALERRVEAMLRRDAEAADA